FFLVFLRLASTRQFKGLSFDINIDATKCAYPTVKICSLRIFQIDKEAPDPRRHMLFENESIGIGRRWKPTARKTGHDLTQNARMIFRFHNTVAASYSEARQIVAEPRQRALVEEAGEIVRAVRHQLAATEPDKQIEEFALNVLCARIGGGFSKCGMRQTQ